ncbi:hypothetical protein [Phaeacidiphilus oryzae]|jgi:hypothetical protein|uniref:hypothetical protein n=1 Tax=Phaeacidiphilus oryzae TaxID=348818 RepID=UPI00056C52F5|nr:hypothetical protein [Phaeacidiphilus oryzae]
MAYVRAAALLVGLTAAGAAASSGTALAAEAPQTHPLPGVGLQRLDPATGLAGLSGATKHVIGPLKDLRLDPWAQSSADPLNNGVSLVPDSPGAGPVSTTPLTSPLSGGGGLSSLPAVGSLTDAMAH